MDNNLNGMTDEQSERLFMLAEEAGEIVHAAMKTARWGYNSHHPRTRVKNKNLLGHEIGNLLKIVKMMVECGEIDEVDIATGEAMKTANLQVYSKFQQHLLADNN